MQWNRPGQLNGFGQNIPFVLLPVTPAFAGM